MNSLLKTRINILYNVAAIFILNIGLFSAQVHGQSVEKILVTHNIECFPSDTCETTFFVFEELAEKLISQKRRRFQNHLFILKLDKIEGINEKVRIQVCEGAAHPNGGNFEGLGCWSNFKKRNKPLNSKLKWGVFVHIYSANQPEKLIINSKNEEEIVMNFLRNLE